MQIHRINPATEESLESLDLYTTAIAADLIVKGQAVFNQWRSVEMAKRSQLMLAMAKILRINARQYASLMAIEMGKPVTAGLLEIEKCALVCEFYATHAEDFLAPIPTTSPQRTGFVCYQPLGVILAIMPWNFPFWQVFRFAVPTIMAGNAALLKHAPITMGTGDAIAALFLEAGFPEHLFQHLRIDNEVASHVIAHPLVAAVSLTGSERAGSIVAAIAASHLKKSVLELGGNDPYIILSDANVKHAAECIVASRLSNTGQVCIAAKRVIVVKGREDELVAHLFSLAKDYCIGDPFDPATKMGPMARQDIRANVHQQVKASIGLGAQLLLGGAISPRIGFYYPPTILVNVKPGMPAFDDEIFGPVIAVTVACDEKEAISLANQSRYGLGAALFTQDLEKAQQLAIQELEVGSCFVNDYVASDPYFPFGGVKCSGFGRELAREGILEFVNTKTVVMTKCR